jgi:hypothetical protein
VRLVWVGASLKERRKGSESKEEGNLCWLLGFNIMGIGFFFFLDCEKGDRCRGD